MRKKEIALTQRASAAQIRFEAPVGLPSTAMSPAAVMYLNAIDLARDFFRVSRAQSPES
jgi:hypothetical protein